MLSSSTALRRETRRRGAALLLAVVLASAHAHARVDGYLNLIGNARDTETETEDGRIETSRSSGWILRFNIDYSRLLTPNLSWRLGGWLEQERSTSEFGEASTDFARSRFRPFAQVNLRTEMSYAEFFWERRNESFEFDVTPDTNQTQETYRFAVGWVPDESVFPSARLLYQRRLRFDDDRVFQDLSEDDVQFISRYQPVDPLEIRYRGGFAVLDNDIDNTEIERTTHNARVSYGDTLWGGRVSLGGDYNYNYGKTETVSSGTGEFFDPVVAFAGLSSIDDFPSTGPLNDNPALIDGNLTVGAGIDLGLPEIGGDDRPRNIGLDFATETDVDVLRVWVDQDLPFTISSSFSWAVYVSDDNLEWNFLTIVPVAPFDVFENRFEIRFPRVFTRFVKLVVEPLSQGVPDAQDFPSIQVTELAAGAIRQGEDLGFARSGDTQIFNFAARVRILPVEALFYDGSAFVTSSSNTATQITTLNGLTYTKRLSRVYSTSSRVAREDNDEVRGRTHANLVSASLTATPLESLRYSVVASYRGEGGDIELGTRDSANVAFTAAATLYEGIELNGTAARSHVRPDLTRVVTVSDQYGVALTLVPHPTLTFNFGINQRDVESSSIEPETTADPSRSSRRAAVSFRPLRNVYFFASRRIDRIASAEERIQDDLSANWSPFPGGRMRLFFSYSETERNLPDAEDRAILASLRWNVRRGTFIDLSYRRLRRDTGLELTRQNSYTGNLRVAF